jgi:NAD(P)-dependent dehydrogenase (short-subunit alcohol dehydrogenase family)
MTTVLITGATRGLGLATARAARARGADVLCAGRTAASAAAAAAAAGGEPVVLDLSSLAAVRSAAATLPHVDAVACNAGVQVVRGTSVTADGFEETFGVNHLAHVALVDALLARDAAPRRVVFVGSATHDPAVRTGTPPPHEGPIAAIALPGDDDAAGGVRSAGLRRYTTSKLLAAATAAALARERPGVHVTCFDPGLMPGTGLARQQGPVARALWATALKGLRVLPFASSASASGRALAALLLADPAPVPSGTYVDHRLNPRQASERARDAAYADRVLADSRHLLERTGGASPRSSA